MKKQLSVGGQALIEGVMMRAGNRVAITLRQPDGTLSSQLQQIEPAGSSLWKLPILRGIYALGQSMKIGIGALNASAEVFGVDEKTNFEIWLEKRFGNKAEKISMFLTIFVSFALAIGLFMVAPTLITGLFKGMVRNPILLSLIEGLIKMTMFVIYVYSISRLKDIRRVFQYHGAEHKSVFTYESGDELTVENAKRYSRLHPRCGTSYIFFVLALSILFFSFVSWTSIGWRVVLKLLFLPLVAGVGFELLKYTAKENAVVRLLRQPGLWLQRITTAEPDDDQLEVALTALRLVIADDN
ncbi:MAG: DUF1385 domain-containing protein [Tissierellia bacterium]|nr:DUF1385 domain-containing protein [Tissierellia bacterium]